MDFYMKLPRGKREFTLFLVTLSIISMNEHHRAAHHLFRDGL